MRNASFNFIRHAGPSAFVSAAALAALALSATALGDPLPGELLKFQQKPLDATVVLPGTTLYWGHDELSTANGSANTGPYQGTFMADDFADKFSQPLVHVTWWGSYFDNQRINGVKRFLVSFESDVPAGPAGPSHPGTPLLTQIVTLGPLAPSSGTFTETPVSAGGPPLNEALYRYNAELRNPFPEQANTVYWLKIVALVNNSVDGGIRWGWHDRDYTTPDPLASTPPAVTPGEANVAVATAPFPVWHFQDDAVSGSVVTSINTDGISVGTLSQSGFAPQHYVDIVDGPQGIEQYSKDLAFELYYVPEPASLAALAMLAPALLRRRRR
jgi:hypothetical protein